MTKHNTNVIKEFLAMIGANIRKKRGVLSREALAKKAGVNKNTIWAIENGRSISLENLAKIIFALDMKPEELFLSDEVLKSISTLKHFLDVAYSAILEQKK